MKRLQPRKSLSEQVAEALANEISEGHLKLGQMLSETRIAEDLGVSRTPVREAFSHLEFRGLLLTKPQSGTYVFDPSQADIDELFDMRGVLELKGFHASQKAAQAELSGVLMQFGEQMEDAFHAKDSAAYAQLDNQFHESFVEHSGNRLLTSLYEPISLKIRALTNNGLVKSVLDEMGHAEHLAIARNFSRNQFQEAIDIATRHMTRFAT